MAGASRDVPEESPEVPEADLSMELQEQLKTSLAECQSRCMQEESELCDKTGQNEPNLENLQEKHAEVALSGMVRMLRSFDPDISKDKLSSDIHSILHADSVVGDLKSQFKGVLRNYVPRLREDWFGDDIERHLAARGAHSLKMRRKMARALGIARARVPTIICDPTLHAVVLSGSGGAVLLGTSAGILGLAGGAGTGAMIGLLPAAFTLGLSIPAAATLGGSVGACAGAASGASLGLLSGGIAGGMAYTYRLEIRGGVVEAKQKSVAGASTAAATAAETSVYLTLRAADAMASAQEQTGKALCSLAHKARLAKIRSWSFAQNRQVQATVASAAGGAMVGGTGGGVMGLTTGSVIGAACGVLPAVFTLGLSIPIGAVVGGSAGLCLGATAGTATGLVGGWAAGYHTHMQSMRRKAGRDVEMMPVRGSAC